MFIQFNILGYEVIPLSLSQHSSLIVLKHGRCKIAQMFIEIWLIFSVAFKRKSHDTVSNESLCHVLSVNSESWQQVKY